MPLDIFEQIIFGNGAWIGFLILSVMAFVAITLYKYLVVITVFLFVLLGVKYFELYSAGNSNLTWFFVFAWICAILQILYMLKVKD